jgi:dihydrolipoamide dehydrogenase
VDKRSTVVERKVDVAIIGAGTAGISAVSEIRKHTEDFVLINGGPLGTTCARVGCMPSKVMIQIANDYYQSISVGKKIVGSTPQTYLDDQKAMNHLRSLRDGFVEGVIEGFIKPLGGKFLEGYAEFKEPTLLQVGENTIRAKHTIIATGTRPLTPKPWKAFEDRVLTSDTLFEQPALPQRIGVIGLGVIGLELGQALGRMGVNVTGFDTLKHIGGLEHPEVAKKALHIFKKEFPIHLGTEASLEQVGRGLVVKAGETRVSVDAILASIGRVPNVERLRLDRLGLTLDDKGLPPFDQRTLQVADLPIFIAGDVNGYRPVLHEAVHEGKISGHNATHKTITYFKRKLFFTIAFSEPNVCSVGAKWQDLEDGNIAVGIATFKSGRARILNQEHGMIALFADRRDGRLLGAEMIAPQGEHLAHLLTWSIQNEQTVFDLLEMPFYHPTIEETLQSALKDLASNLKD